MVTSHTCRAPAFTRRSFFAFAGGAAAGGFLGCLSMPPVKDGTYSVALLGDTHFDSTDPKFYHRDYTSSTSVARWKRHLAEHVRNADMWAERMPRLLAASAACARGRTAFVLQVGDLVQGDCNNRATHRRMIADMLALMDETYGADLPFVTVVGNHDIRGKGAAAVYDAMMPGVLARELNRPVEGTTFAFRYGPDAFLALDFNAPRPDFAVVERLLAETADARHTFVVSHGPVVPSGTSRWFLYGHPGQDAARRKLRALLAARNAILLAGHTHRIEYHDCLFPEGRLTQFVANSVWTKERPGPLEILEEGADAYGRRVGGVSRHAGSSRTQGLKELVEEYRPFMKGYLFANGVGHYRLNVSEERVAVDFYAGDACTPARTFVLRG